MIRQPWDCCQRVPLRPQPGVAQSVQSRGRIPDTIEKLHNLGAMGKHLLGHVPVLRLPVHVDQVKLSIGVLPAEAESVLDQLGSVEKRRTVGPRDRCVQGLKPAAIEQRATGCPTI
jgi:hypothetical protein